MVVVNLYFYSKWVDDFYLVFGKVQYYKCDYEVVEVIFCFFFNEFSLEEMCKKEKKVDVVKKVSKKKKKKKKCKKFCSKKNKMSKKKVWVLKKYNKVVCKVCKFGGQVLEKFVIL